MADYKTDFQIPGNLESINYVVDKNLSMEFAGRVRLEDADTLAIIKFVVNVNDEPVATKEFQLTGVDSPITVPFEMADRDRVDIQVTNLSNTVNLVVGYSAIRKASA